MWLPLSLANVGSDRSLADNVGAMGELEWWVANKKARPIASLETRIRVVTSIEDLNFWESIVLYMRVVLWSCVANYGL